jgi:dihydroorotate dehydrogenase (NAD+) catalytic subunit
MGGVVSADDARDFVAVGASAVALGTILFSDPWAAARIRAGLEAEGITSPVTLQGVAPHPASAADL